MTKPHTLPPLSKRLFSVESPKAIKAREYGYLNAILYMAPHEFAGVGNLCPHASPACIAACLGLWSGQAAMTPRGHKYNSTRLSRANKARHFMTRRAEFMTAAALQIAALVDTAADWHLTLAIRLNGATDIAWESIRLVIDAATAAAIAKKSGGRCNPAPGIYRNLMEVFPAIQFLDYTKNPGRMLRVLPPNYHLTFSRAENNESAVESVLDAGRNVAVVFSRLPETYKGRRVINGDSHDLRFLDPTGVVVGLIPKGWKAKKDDSGFVVRI